MVLVYKIFGSLYHSKKYLIPLGMLYLYKNLTRPKVYYCHIWPGAAHSLLSILDGIQYVFMLRRFNNITLCLPANISCWAHELMEINNIMLCQEYHQIMGELWKKVNILPVCIPALLSIVGIIISTI